MKGFDLILNRLRQDPSQTTLRLRYVALVTDLEDIEEKIAAVLKLLDVYRANYPAEALELAYLICKYDPKNIKAIEIIVEIFRRQGRIAQADLMQTYLKKLDSSRSVPANNSQSDSLSTGGIPAQENSERVSFDPVFDLLGRSEQTVIPQSNDPSNLGVSLDLMVDSSKETVPDREKFGSIVESPPLVLESSKWPSSTDLQNLENPPMPTLQIDQIPIASKDSERTEVQSFSAFNLMGLEESKQNNRVVQSPFPFDASLINGKPAEVKSEAVFFDEGNQRPTIILPGPTELIEDFSPRLSQQSTELHSLKSEGNEAKSFDVDLLGDPNVTVVANLGKTINLKGENINESQISFSEEVEEFTKLELSDSEQVEEGHIEVDPIKVESRKVEPRKVEPRKVEPRKVEPRKVEPRKVEPRKVEPRKVEPRKVEPRKVEPRKVEPRKVEPRKVEPRKVDPRNIDPREIDDHETVVSFNKTTEIFDRTFSPGEKKDESNVDVDSDLVVDFNDFKTTSPREDEDQGQFNEGVEQFEVEEHTLLELVQPTQLKDSMSHSVTAESRQIDVFPANSQLEGELPKINSEIDVASKRLDANHQNTISTQQVLEATKITTIMESEHIANFDQDEFFNELDQRDASNVVEKIVNDLLKAGDSVSAFNLLRDCAEKYAGMTWWKKGIDQASKLSRHSDSPRFDVEAFAYSLLENLKDKLNPHEFIRAHCTEAQKDELFKFFLVDPPPGMEILQLDVFIAVGASLEAVQLIRGFVIQGEVDLNILLRRARILWHGLNWQPIQWRSIDGQDKLIEILTSRPLQKASSEVL
jgi:hypothetical protein